MSYIEREAFLAERRHLYCENCARRKNGKGKFVYEIGDAPCRACDICDVLDAVEDFPAADVRPVGLLEQVEWERDTALAQLAEIGKSFGEKMDDVRPVVRGKWINQRADSEMCSACGVRFYISALFAVGGNDEPNFCPNCGADMREES